MLLGLALGSSAIFRLLTREVRAAAGRLGSAVQRRDLVGDRVGQTGVKTREKIEEDNRRKLKAEREVLAEVNILGQVDHPGVVRLLDAPSESEWQRVSRFEWGHAHGYG